MQKPLKIVHVSDLDGARFNIPSYQRGYRWETKQVHALLNDIIEFGSSNEPFYCLQPLVVVKNESLSGEDGQNVVYDVIDGQQRLTTLFLILHCIQNSLNRVYSRLDYKIRYERFGTGESNHYDDDRILNFGKLCGLDNDEVGRNADYFYLSQAIKDINEWLKYKAGEVSGPDSIIFDLIAPAWYKKCNYLTTGIGDPNKDLRDVRFIWYEADNADVKASDVETTAIATFRRLNHGKTPLTAAELIKALLFQCDLYPEKLQPLMKEVAFRRSTEWNNMEVRLQNPFFWNMICPADYNRPSHIDLVLSFVARELLMELPDGTIKTLETDSDYDYQVFDSYLHEEVEHGDNGEAYKTKVEYVWNKIHDCFTMFRNWYEDRSIYHYIGLLVNLTEGKGKIHIKFLWELKTEYGSKTRTEFIGFLKSKIAEIIKLNDSEQLNKLNYTEHWKQIVNVLKVFNVEKTLESESDGSRFPFDWYRQMTPSLEHIHPQNLSEAEIKFDTLCDWYQDRQAAIRQNNKSDEREVGEALSTLDLYLTKESGEKKYREHLEECSNAIAEVDRFFDTLAKVDSTVLHNISNLALVDRDTNSALGNKLLDCKRAILFKRNRQYSASQHKEGAYLMAGTRMVFNKEFSEDVKNLKFWEPDDRANYMSDIESVYEKFVSLLK